MKLPRLICVILLVFNILLLLLYILLMCVYCRLYPVGKHSNKETELNYFSRYESFPFMANSFVLSIEIVRLYVESIFDNWCSSFGGNILMQS